MKTKSASAYLGRLPILAFLAAILWAGFVPDGGIPGLSSGSLDVRAEGSLPISGSAGDTAAPVLVRDYFPDFPPGGPSAEYGDGDTLRLDTIWNRNDLLVEAILTDFIKPGQKAAKDTVTLAFEGDSLYSLVYPIAKASTKNDFSGYTISLRAISANYDTTVVSESSFCLNNKPPVMSDAGLEPSRPYYQGGDLVRLVTEWDGIDLDIDRVRADLSAIAPGLSDTLLLLEPEGAAWALNYTIPINSADRAPDGTDIPITLFADNTGCGMATDIVRITLDHTVPSAPTLLEFARLDLDAEGFPRSLKNGDTVRIWTRWDADGLEISANFSAIAPNDSTGRPVTKRVGEAEYQITYQIPLDNSADDGWDLPVIIGATRPNGHQTNDSSVRLCLSNHQPLHVTSEIRDQKTAYRGGDSLTIITRWTSESGLYLNAGGDFRRIQPALADSFYAGEPLFLETLPGPPPDTMSFAIHYQIPILPEDQGPDGDNILIPIVARDTLGCGLARIDLVRIKMDTTPPDTIAPRIDALPFETELSSIFVSGTTSPEASQVALLRQGAVQSRVEVDPITGRFGGDLELLPDAENIVRAWAEDSLQNKTRASDPVFVFQVSSTVLVIPEPFVIGESLVEIRDPLGLSNVRVRIFDVEGALVEQFEPEGNGLEYRLDWDGTDRNGRRVRQGYFIVRAEWTKNDGRKETRTEGMIVTDGL